MVDSDTTNVCLNREPIADQPRRRVLQSQMLRYTCPFIILRFAFMIGSHVVSKGRLWKLELRMGSDGVSNGSSPTSHQSAFGPTHSDDPARACNLQASVTQFLPAREMLHSWMGGLECDFIHQKTEHKIRRVDRKQTSGFQRCSPLIW